jgi:hypothetical protein
MFKFLNDIIKPLPEVEFILETKYTKKEVLVLIEDEFNLAKKNKLDFFSKKDI